MDKEKEKFIDTLKNHVYEELKIVSINSLSLIASICYVDVIVGEEDKEEDSDKIYLVVDGFSSDNVYINYKAIRYVKETKDSIEIGV